MPLQGADGILNGHFSDTGRTAVIDNAFEAMFAGFFIGFGVPAGAQTEMCQQKIQCHFSALPLGKGPKY